MTTIDYYTDDFDIVVDFDYAGDGNLRARRYVMPVNLGINVTVHDSLTQGPSAHFDELNQNVRNLIHELIVENRPMVRTVHVNKNLPNEILIYVRSYRDWDYERVHDYVMRSLQAHLIRWHM